MKKLFFSLLLLFIASANLSAQTTETAKVKYWYYPSQNVYYNDATNEYWYYDQTTTKWITGKELAGTYTPVMKTDTRYPIYYTGGNIWEANKNHKVKYKVKRNGTIKTKVKPMDNN